MTPKELVKRLEAVYGRNYDSPQLKEFLDFLNDYTPEILDKVFRPLITRCKYLPVPFEFCATLREEHLDLDGGTRPTDLPHENWPRTDCPHCLGEGLVALFWRLLPERGTDGVEHEMQLEAVAPFSSLQAANQRHESTGMIDALFRCLCPAGQAETLSRGWPRWDGRRRYRRKG